MNMKLQERLDEKKKEFESSVPEETLAIIHRATEDLRKSGILDRVVKDDLKSVYKNFGINLPDYNGDDSWTLPLPARYIIDRSGLIRYAEISVDYTVRPDPSYTIEALKSVIGEQ
jgi:peroxiredoxin